MKKYLFVLLSIFILCLSGISYAGEKEELQLKLENLSLKLETLKRDSLVQEAIKVLMEANQIQQKIQALDKAGEKK